MLNQQQQQAIVPVTTAVREDRLHRFLNKILKKKRKILPLRRKNYHLQ